MSIAYHETALPILRKADVAVVGGSLAGIAAAVRLAEGELSVVLIEPRTYLGREITATLRPWLTMGERTAPASLPEPIRAILADYDYVTFESADEIPLRPDTVKLSLEDVLFRADVGLLYASLPVGLCQADDGRTGLIIGNKSGRQVVHCRTIIDATETALIARLAGGTFEPPAAGSTRFARTLEFDRVEPLEQTALPVPEWLQIAGNRAILHRGYRGPSHILIEIELDLPYTPDLGGAGYVEWEARRRSMSLAGWLVSEHPEFASGRFAGSSHELHGRWTPSLTGPAPGWSAATGGMVDATNGDGHRHLLPLERFAGPAPNLWCLNESSRLDTGQTAMFLDPVRASWLGESFATTLLETWQEREDDSLPNASTGRTDAGDVNTAIEVREPASPQRGCVLQRQTAPATTIPVHRTADV
ncbi:MAG: FAD-dependent oxidoreductase, partial [Chloroflexota bacterium]|nr:FAD-dependent oxidoreductase [Chloroflexota bacterium]